MHLEIFGKIVGRWLAVRFDASSLPLLPSLPFHLGAGGKERGRRDLPIYTPNPLRVCIPAVCSRPASHPRGFSHSGIRLVGFLLASGRPVLRLGTRRATKFLVHPPPLRGIRRVESHARTTPSSSSSKIVADRCGIRHSLDPQLFSFDAHRSQGKCRPGWMFDYILYSLEFMILFRSFMIVWCSSWEKEDRRVVFSYLFDDLICSSFLKNMMCLVNDDRCFGLISTSIRNKISRIEDGLTVNGCQAWARNFISATIFTRNVIDAPIIYARWNFLNGTSFFKSILSTVRDLFLVLCHACCKKRKEKKRSLYNIAPSRLHLTPRFRSSKFILLVLIFIFD